MGKKSLLEITESSPHFLAPKRKAAKIKPQNQPE